LPGHPPPGIGRRIIEDSIVARKPIRFYHLRRFVSLGLLWRDIPMIRTTGFALALGFVAIRSTSAAAPFADTHYHLYQSGAELGFFEVMTTSYVDIPGTAKTITAPAGKAVFHWTLGGTNTYYALIRPVIGTHAPNSPPIYHDGSGTVGNLTGSWSADIEGGTFEVKLQAALSADFPTQSVFSCQPDFGTGWTLTVLPPSAEGVPAMSAASLVVLVSLLLGGEG
jgi:hypothetical protein